MPTALLVPLLLPVAPPPTDEDAPARPNVLLVIADDVAERDIDHVETPRFDALAARGLRFRRAYSNPTCSPARWSLHFGRYHSRDAGVACEDGRVRASLAPSPPSLPATFARAGYRTALFGKWHLGAHSTGEEDLPWERATEPFGYASWRAGLAANVKNCGGRSYTRWLRVDDGESRMTSEYCTAAIRDAFLAWLPEAPGVPWFAVVSFQAPHGPFHVPPDAGEDPGDLSSRARYELMLQDLDRTLGTLLEAVDLAQTLVLFVGDNGTPPGVEGPHQVAGRTKTTTYEDGIRVPMVWAGPGVVRGRESRSLVHFVDVLPTLAQLLGADPGTDAPGAEDELDGISVLPLLGDPTLPAHDLVWCGNGPSTSAPRGDFAVVTARYKYRRVGPDEFLFDLEDDPREDVNLAASEEHAELRRGLAERLEEHRPATARRGKRSRRPR